MDWLDSEQELGFSKETGSLAKCYRFIEEGLYFGDQVLVHSYRGINRSVCVIVYFLMKKGIV